MTAEYSPWLCHGAWASAPVQTQERVRDRGHQPLVAPVHRQDVQQRRQVGLHGRMVPVQDGRLSLQWQTWTPIQLWSTPHMALVCSLQKSQVAARAKHPRNA